ncbi:helicase associated domain-containing protein [Streptomyces sp. NPDC048507]|uniref:helicase associated domain-containing protein n=1 Tax=Streptomyces sp. NPDC048507 TaxID=3365560 RepID=UPI0037120A03
MALPGTGPGPGGPVRPDRRCLPAREVVVRLAAHLPSRAMTGRRAAELEQLGIVWDTPDAGFAGRLTVAQAYYEQHGTLAAPRHVTSMDQAIGQWLTTIRRAGRDRPAWNPGTYRRTVDWQRQYAYLAPFPDDGALLPTITPGVTRHGDDRAELARRDWRTDPVRATGSGRRPGAGMGRRQGDTHPLGGARPEWRAGVVRRGGSRPRDARPRPSRRFASRRPSLQEVSVARPTRRAEPPWPRIRSVRPGEHGPRARSAQETGLRLGQHVLDEPDDRGVPEQVAAELLVGFVRSPRSRSRSMSRPLASGPREPFASVLAGGVHGSSAYRRSSGWSGLGGRGGTRHSGGCGQPGAGRSGGGPGRGRRRVRDFWDGWESTEGGANCSGGPRAWFRLQDPGHPG